MATIFRVGTSTCGLAAGADATIDALATAARELGLDAKIERTGCLGACHAEPLVEVRDGADARLYGPVTPANARGLVGRAPDEGPPLLSRRDDRADYPFLGRQVKVTTRLCGQIDPLSLDDYLAHDGYRALRAALAMPPEDVIQIVSSSRLRGRGGAGFPTGLKWRLAREATGDPKYVVCNADEGDPGAFMDRTMIEGDPHRLIEGMVIAAHAIGATRGYVYVRAEYPMAVAILRRAIDQAIAYGALGPNVLGSGREFALQIVEGAGAFVCGEETALMHSIEGKRGMPRMRPPYPAQSGLWGQPTNINNVETYASVPAILLGGPTWFAGIGTAASGGTKAFALSGAIRRPGLVEIPIGIALRDLLLEIGGGARPGHQLKAVQLGGPSGGCLPERLFDTIVDYDDLRRTGTIMGSGGMVAIDETTCVVDFARYFLTFSTAESCGKCAPCRIGTRRMLQIVQAIATGRATESDRLRLEALADVVRTASLCGLGQTAPNPALTTMRYFADEYRAHLEERRCPAGVCAMGPAA